MAEEVRTYTFCLTRYPDDPLGYAGRFELPNEEVEQLPVRADGSRRFVCQVGDTKPWHAAFISDGAGKHFIIVNKERIKAFEYAGYDLKKLKVTLLPDTSSYGMAMPEELGELLHLDSEGDKYFHALTPGKQRALIHLVAKPKGEATRIRKAVGIVEYLKDVRGRLDFRELNEALKVKR